MTEQTTREQLVVEELAQRIERLLRAEGGAVKESRIVSRFRGFAEPRNAALGSLAEAGKIRKVRSSKTGTTLVTLATTRRGLKTTARAEEARLVALEGERREALKPTAAEYNGGDDSFSSYRFYLEMLAAGAMSACELPFKVATEREECPKVQRPRRWKGGPVKQAEAQTQDTISHSMRRDIEERRTNGDAAWNTAKAHYVANLPTLAHKILHLLRRDGDRTEASLLPLAKAEEQPVPEAMLKRTLQELGEAGKIRKRRERSTGRIVFDAFGKMPERELETLLIGVMAESKNGIPVPEDTKLARRVAAFRKAKAKSKAERQTEAVETEQQPVVA
jgi:hypothetical protein